MGGILFPLQATVNQVSKLACPRDLPLRFPRHAQRGAVELLMATNMEPKRGHLKEPPDGHLMAPLDGHVMEPVRGHLKEPPDGHLMAPL